MKIMLHASDEDNFGLQKLSYNTFPQVFLIFLANLNEN